MSEPDYVAVNREAWTDSNREYTDAEADRAWRAEEITWGMFATPESEVRILGDVDGLDVIDLGCGTGYFSAWLARRGARPVGVDITPAQLATARRMQAETGIEFALIEASAEDVPLPDASFDLAFSEYGASIWCDPYAWLPEAWRLLRPGGRLVFLCNSPLVILCAVEVPDSTSETLQRPQRGLHKLSWSDGGTEFHLGHGDMLGDEVVARQALFTALWPAVLLNLAVAVPVYALVRAIVGERVAFQPSGEVELVG